MPRAFLITHRRYNSEKDGEIRECSPEHKVSLPEMPSGSSTSSSSSPGHYEQYIEETTNSSDCPDELYNLTKLAEVSLAAASGQLYHHRHLSAAPYAVTSQTKTTETTGYAHKLFDRDRDRVNIVRSDDTKSPNTTNGSKIAIGDGLVVGEGTQHECPDCGKRYSTSSNLARHRQTHRSLADKKARRCPHCDKVYVSMPAYSMHVRTHVQGCRCPYCGKCFSRPWLLQGHIRTHTGEKPFRCSVCQKAFADKSNLRAHVQTHSDTKPHVCGRCGKAFALKSYLYKHEESSCMRGQRSTTSDLLSPGKSYQAQIPIFQAQTPHSLVNEELPVKPPGPSGIVLAAPTPVIVRARVDRQFRSTVISPNPERAVLSFVERPTAIISTVATGRCCVPLTLSEEQPMDFSTKQEAYKDNQTNGRYSVGLAIAV